MKKSRLFPLLSVLAAALLLFVVSSVLRNVAQSNARTVQLQMMRTLLPGSENFVVESYTGEDPNVRTVHKGENGFVIETAAQGYADEVVLLVGVSNNGSVTGLVVKEIHETWGLGMQALTDWQFLAQYLNTSGEAEIGTNVDALTGATVTSKAITRCVNSAVAVVTGADTVTTATKWEGAQ